MKSGLVPSWLPRHEVEPNPLVKQTTAPPGGPPGLKQLRITGTSVILWGTHTHCFAHMCCRVSRPCEARANIRSIRSELGEEGGDLPTAQGCKRRDRRVHPRQQLGRTLTRPNLGEWARSPPARWLPALLPAPPRPPDTHQQDRTGRGGVPSFPFIWASLR